MPTITNGDSVLASDTVQTAQEIINGHIVRRIWDKDAALWKSDPVVQQKIDNRLGWLTAPDEFLKRTDELTSFAEEVRKAGYTDAVLLGMGGSSLCVEVLYETFGSKDGFLRMHVLDSTHPDQVLAIERAVDLEHTLFIVASKSGTTLEPETFFSYFWNKLEYLDGTPEKDTRGAHFCAITDPGTLLEKLGTDSHFRRVFPNPPDLGGRFSVLTYFGMLPAALMGIDIEELLSRAASEASISKSEEIGNPALILGSFLATNVLESRNKLTIVTDPAIRSFGYWAEQLIAESTGKEGKGILPIEGESLTGNNSLPPEALSADRMYVYITVDEQTMPEQFRNTPDHLELHMSDIYDLGAEFFRWEFATAIVGKMLDINPFDEPNVAEAKAATNKVLSQYDGRNALTFPDIRGNTQGIAVAGENASATGTPSTILDSFLRSHVTNGSYIAIMAFIERNAKSMSALASLRRILEITYQVPVTVGYGPRFLHSTGQLHKGGPDNGVFVQLIDSPKEDVLIPEKNYSFGTLVLAQAIGDYETLKLKQKPVINFNLGEHTLEGIAALA